MKIDIEDLGGLVGEAQALSERIIADRRVIHRNPELGLSTPDTQARILSELDKVGVRSVRKGRGCSSVVADIEGSGDGSAKTVALRADMDALPLAEHSGLEFGSIHEGRMHACGHDGHVAMLLGAARLLAAHRDRFSGCVRLLFQPGEEGYGGARVMLEEGALDGVDAVFALHLEPSSPPGVVLSRSGPILAADDGFAVTFRGAGGHASMPHHTRDPIPAIGPFVDGLSHVAARETDPDDRAVFSVTKVQAGSAFNVIPPTAECFGTIRTLSPKRRETAHAALQRVAEGVAASRRLEVEVHIARGYPPTVNDAAAVERATRVAASLGLRPVTMRSAFMGAEDFSYMLERVPGAMVFLGCQVPGGGPLHSDRMMLDESVLALGSALHAAVALDLLSS